MYIYCLWLVRCLAPSILGLAFVQRAKTQQRYLIKTKLHFCEGLSVPISNFTHHFLMLFMGTSLFLISRGISAWASSNISSCSSLKHRKQAEVISQWQNSAHMLSLYSLWFLPHRVMGLRYSPWTGCVTWINKLPWESKRPCSFGARTPRMAWIER